MIQKIITTKSKMQHQKLQNVSCNATRQFVTIYATMSKIEKSSEELQIEFGYWLKTQRKMAGLTQAVIANAAPIDRVHLARIESGESGSKRDTVISIIEAINTKSTTGHAVDLNEALDRFYGRWQDLGEEKNIETIAFDENVRLQLLGAKNFSEEDKKEFAESFQVAYEIAKRRIAEKKKRDE